jgi:hypothetical protein
MRDEFVALRFLGGFYYFFQIRTVFSVCNVLKKAPVEKYGILRHKAKMFAERFL